MLEETIILAIVVGLTEVAKRVGLVGRIVPVFAVVAGIGVAFIANLGGAWDVALQGLIVGLTAIGAYEVGKTTVLGK
ncbi:MAG TPA: hypothetical protein PKK37_03895 [Candidatus Pacearchaeota archaeon]|jgi:hypothetical protein|nr:hypothetical protein [Candidatus Pacearchaeota archaeon]